MAELRLKKFKIMITTHGMLCNTKGGLTILHHFGKWDRIIVDEIHVMRNKKSKISKSICGLQGGIKWGLTGTPVQNTEKDLFSLYKFLDIPAHYFY